MSYNNKYDVKFARKNRNIRLQIYKDLYGTISPSQFVISTKFREAKKKGCEEYVFMSIYDQPADKPINGSKFSNSEDQVNKRIIENGKIRIEHNKRVIYLNFVLKIKYF